MAKLKSVDVLVRTLIANSRDARSSNNLMKAFFSGRQASGATSAMTGLDKSEILPKQRSRVLSVLTHLAWNCLDL